MWIENPNPTEDEVVVPVKRAGTEAMEDEIVTIGRHGMSTLLKTLNLTMEQFCKKHGFEKAHWDFGRKAWQLRLADSDYD